MIVRGCGGWLVEEAEMGAAAGPGLEGVVEHFAEAEGAVIEGVATGGGVVAIKVSLAVADTYPVGN